MWRLTALAEAHIARLEADGIKVTPQQVLHIQQLSLDAESPVDGVSLARGVPVRVGNVDLWPLTIAAHCFFEEAQRLPELRGGWSILETRRTRLRVFALAYSMAFARDPSRVGIAPDIRVIRKWSRGLCCRFEDLTEAVNLVFGDGAKPFEDKPERRADARRSASALAQEAVILCGGTPELWEYEVSMEYVAEIIRRASRLKASFAGAEMKEDDNGGLRRLAIYIDGLRKEAAQNG